MSQDSRRARTIYRKGFTAARDQAAAMIESTSPAIAEQIRALQPPPRRSDATPRQEG